MSFKKQQNEERIALIDKLFKDPLLGTNEQNQKRKRDIKLS